LLAYASAYLKCHYLAAFTVAMLNNQPMGFYSPATLVKDAQRHGQRFRPVDILRSDFKCTVETDGKQKYVRLGLNYVRGLNSVNARKIEQERRHYPFASLRDLVRRVPELQKDEISALAELGALNALPKEKSDRHRRGALWQAELALQPAGDLLEAAVDDGEASPLKAMTDGQRTYADFSNSGLTIGKHPMAHYREHMRKIGVLDVATAKAQRNGMVLTVAGCVITRQRPGTAKGFVFMSLEDETGIINIIVQPDLFDRRRQACTTAPYVLVKGVLQSIAGVISVKAGDIEELSFRGAAAMQSHDFH
jgi:error-prone DNA polymerase